MLKVKEIVILGMHRSGTSMVAGILNKMGVNMGEDLLGKNPSNPFGHFEDRDFYNMNRNILCNAGGSWEIPPLEKDILEQKENFDERIRSLIEKKNNYYNNWGWKDPRTSLTIKLYIPYLINPYFIVCHRKDIAIAQSLQKRDNFKIEKGLKLAEIYNERINDFFRKYDGLKKLDLYYEDFISQPTKNIKKIINFLSLEISQDQIEILNNFIIPKNKIRKISKRMLILKYLKKGITKPRKVPMFLCKYLRKIK